MGIRGFLVLFLLSVWWVGLAASAQGQSSSESARKLVRKVDPTYPEMARRINIAGTVKVNAIVAPDGTVKTVEPVGGSPLLVQASVDAIRKWKFAPAAAETKERANFDIAAIPGRQLVGLCEFRMRVIETRTVALGQGRESAQRAGWPEF